MRPAGPLPGTNCNSMPRSHARRRTAGDASGLAPGARATALRPSPAVRERDMIAAPPFPLRSALDEVAGSPSLILGVAFRLPLPACGERVGVRGFLGAARAVPAARAGTAAVLRSAATLPAPATSSVTSGDPTGRFSPTSPPI